jgi:L-iditol 2-dehydrogenase
MGGGNITIVDEPTPACPPGGLLVRTEASGLCSGELMDWYMDRKIPHVLGHEVAGTVVESQDERYPPGHRVFAHHHAPCLQCSFCARGLYVHCEQWKRTKLLPGGMAEFFAVSDENLTDTFLVDDLRPVDAALIEPLACVVKSLLTASIPLPLRELGEGTHARSEQANPLLASPGAREELSFAVIGLGAMGLLHLLLLKGAIGYDISPARVEHAGALGLTAKESKERAAADVVFVCPGNKAALDLAIEIINPGGTVMMFAPQEPGAETPVDLSRLYFNDIRIVNAYSCGPDDTRAAAQLLREGKIKAEQIVSDFIAIDELPDAYQKMKRGEILKAMVVFEEGSIEL